MTWRTIGAATVPPSPSAFTTIAATAIFGLAGRGEGREPGVDVLRRLLAGPQLLAGLKGARAQLGRPGLARDLDPGQLRGDAGAVVDDADHELAHRRRGVAARRP